jgi:hypothetical protein
MGGTCLCHDWDCQQFELGGALALAQVLQSMSYTCQDKIELLGYDVCGDSLCGVRLT